MKTKIVTGIVILTSLFTLSNAFTQSRIPGINGVTWLDSEGNPINAHGGGLLKHNNVYYWFGEIKKGKTWLVPGQDWEDYRVPAGGVACYSSTDFKKWKFEGVALSPVTGNTHHDLDTSRVIERPKVIYNETTKQFVMWMHIDSNDYAYAKAGVATSNNPAGPYTYHGSVRPNGNMSRDMTLYKDVDNKAYLIYASESNRTMHICQLSDDYLSVTTLYTRITSAENREAPAVFKYKKKYYLITSACTGWAPNTPTVAVADSLLGVWKQMGNPCIGPGSETTFQSQSTFVLAQDEKKGKFLFMADRWNKSDLEKSTYVWLPLIFKKGKPGIRFIQ